MRRKLLRLYWLGVAVTLALGLFTVGTMVYFAISDTEKTLLSILSTASAWTEGSTENLPNLARQIAQSAPPLRVIFLLPQGIVLVDSAEATQVAMENMLAFPEIQGALQGLESSSIRLSGGVPTIYAARLLSDRLLIHLSFPLTDVTRLLWGYALGMAVLLCALLILLRRGLASFSRQMIAQLEQIQGLLSGETQLQEVKNGEIFYPELRPTMQSICYLIGRLHSDLASVRKAQDMRRDFAANASHELKSPLTSIQGFAEMLSEGMADSPEEQAFYLDCILKETRRMRAVIDDILLLGQAELGQNDPLADVNVRAVAQEVADALSGQCRNKNISLSIEGELTVRCVERDIWKILYNLVSNAIRYGREGGYIRIEMGNNRLIVEDNGIGIEAVHLPLIFEQFYRVDKGRSRDEGGTGLGLSIVSQLARKYGGNVRVESEPGKGSRFIVSFVRNV